MRKNAAAFVEVADVGPLSQLSRNESSPTIAEVIGTIEHSCPSEFVAFMVGAARYEQTHDLEATHSV